MEFYGTIGPACAQPETLQRMVEAGMTGIRMNLSHGPLSAHKDWLDMIHAVGIPQLLIDLQGPELRTGRLAQPLTLPEGGTLRLGAYPCQIVPGTKMFEAYGVNHIYERHRHRYEFNNDFRQALSDAGLTVSGTSPDGYIVETVELTDSPFYVGVQFHPEFKSRPNKPHPLFLSFVKASLELSENS